MYGAFPFALSLSAASGVRGRIGGLHLPFERWLGGRTGRACGGAQHPYTNSEDSNDGTKDECLVL
jgi:hypothetical protein